MFPPLSLTRPIPPTISSPIPTRKSSRPHRFGKYIRIYTNSTPSQSLGQATDVVAPRPTPNRATTYPVQATPFSESPVGPPSERISFAGDNLVVGGSENPGSVHPSRPNPDQLAARDQLTVTHIEDSSEAMARHRSGSGPQGSRRARVLRFPSFANESASTETPGNLHVPEPGSIAEIDVPHEASNSALAGYPPDHPMPTIKFIAYQDLRASRPSLAFPTTSRTLPHEDCVIRVGRYSERDINPNPPPNVPSSAPVGFKSKVVSRKHCEFWFSNGQWYIKDVKSSSGTFLNHIRLSQPNTESRPFPLNDGDIVQLGIDFRGGEEMIFRCVKIRVECNRAWQKSLNNFNITTHKRLRNLGKPKSSGQDTDAASTHSSECSICLISVAPCQSLFVAPCSHVWHYKCIRPLLNDQKHWPQFTCPNCRAITDLEADPEDPEWPEEDEDEDATSDPEHAQNIGNGNDQLDVTSNGENDNDELLAEMTSGSLSLYSANHPLINSSEQSTTSPASNLLSRRAGSRSSSSQLHEIPASKPLDIPGRASSSSSRPALPSLQDRGNGDPSTNGDITPNVEMLTSEGPTTPRNDAGPFVFDGSAGRLPRRQVNSLAEAIMHTK